VSISKTIRDNINATVELAALGNTSRKMKDVAADLINASGMDHEEVAANCYLCQSTITNLASGKTKNPQSETIERVFRAFAYQLDMKAVKLNAKYANKPKK
jgi:transcriptional regulator with XRE-family HTH domain